MAELSTLKWVPHWVSHLGCIKGCLDYLDIEVSDAWLFGGTGHAFVLNVHEDLCPSGPTAWNTSPLHHLGNGLGFHIDGVVGNKREEGFAEAQRSAYQLARDSIDAGLPCFGWELEIPEYYTVQGCDEVGYYFSGPGCSEGKGPKPWQELGRTGIGMLEMYRLTKSQALEDLQIVKRALAFALEHSVDSTKWVLPDYGAGLAGYDTWIAALRGGRADAMGVSYNSAVWRECRGFAALFLKEARQRLDGMADEPLAEAIDHYQTVFDQLSVVVDLFPFFGMDPKHVKDAKRVETAIASLEVARSAETAGLRNLRSLVGQL